MRDSASFLSRWSRRKRAAAKDEPERKAPSDADAAPKPAAGDERPTARDNDEEPSVAVEAGAEQPAFDLSKLPSIESITAETDIRPFLARGVPSALRQAALRRMWSVDPTIRDFIEMAENQWDFNAPGEILGFDLAAPSGDVRRMVVDILGDKPPPDSQTQSAASQTDDAAAAPVPTTHEVVAHRSKVTQPLQDDKTSPGDVAAALQHDSQAAGQTVVTQQGARDGENAVASQQNAAMQGKESFPVRRSHGRAQPK